MSAINEEGEALLKRSEQFVGYAYPDPASPMGRALQENGMWTAVLNGAQIPVRFMTLDPHPWTIGYGFTEGVKYGDRMTLEQANARLDSELAQDTERVRSMCRVEPNENQLAALVVCAWNIGLRAMEGSTMIRAHNRSDFASAARAFNLWDRAGGAVSHALVVRRAAESALYLKPVAGDIQYAVAPAMPQSVMGESSLLRSPIVTTTTGSGVIGVLATVADQINSLRDSFSSLSFLSPYMPYLLIAGAIAATGYVVYNRWQQRREGRA